MAVSSFYIISASLALIIGTASCSLSLTPDGYWNRVFPSTPMPNAIRELLSPSPSGSGGRNLTNSSPPTPIFPTKACCCKWAAMSGYPGLSPMNCPPNNAPLYSLREDMQPGSKMNVTMMITPVALSGGRFFPRQRAQAIPFSTSNLTAILKMFSIQPESDRASLIRETLQDCEAAAIKGEVKHCATSLESMIDFVVAELGTREIHAVFTSAVNREEAVKVRSYRVGAGGGRMMTNKVMTCHNTVFPYAVFYCHNFAGTRVYMVPLVAEDGSRVSAIALCHIDTSNWNPRHESFRVLGVKPGTVPICHFIVEGLAWVPN
ncbi:BURP domain-containing protein 5-like [Nymphaea colorata]|uniref:BURP domain-containing protein 5-like n=1 Tax=Nymphaea colorata TaxID=210225 RepID=UPI00129DFBDA|nr:BURP domain-containing protein 5-like [Nymphaea colorata]